VESLWDLVEKWGEIWRPVQTSGEMWGVQVESCGDLFGLVETTRGVFVDIRGRHLHLRQSLTNITVGLTL
jgi:hypothetical protein